MVEEESELAESCIDRDVGGVALHGCKQREVLE